MSQPVGATRIGSVETRWEYITPERAAMYLSHNGMNRRRFRTVSGRYSTDMANGRWMLTHQGIAFNKNGVLQDGQHRLEAIIDSGVSQWMLVTTGLDEQAMEAIDRAKMRTLANTLQIIGHVVHGSRQVAIARSMMLGHRSSHGSLNYTEMQVRDFIDQHIDAILFASANCPQTFGAAPISSVIGRAYYTVPPADLTRFIQVCTESTPDPLDVRPGDRTGRVFAKWVEGIKGKINSGPSRAMAYYMTQRALRHYLNGKDIKLLRPLSSNAFPLPGENAEEDDDSDES